MTTPDPITFSVEEIELFADSQFFPAKARITEKVRQTWEQLHKTLQAELRGKTLLAPERFNADAVQFVKGEHLEDFPYQYLDFPRHYTREEKFSFRSLFWWGHFVVFALILEGSSIGRYKQNLINRFSDIADKGICLCLAPSLWEWKQGPGYTLELTRDRKSEVAAVLSNRSFFKLGYFVPMKDSLIQFGELVRKGHETFQTILPVITE